MSEEDYTPTRPHGMSRAERQERRTRRQLRCEWCNKMTEVDHMTWLQVAKDKNGHWLPAEEVIWLKQQAIYCCDRWQCQRARPEGFKWKHGLFWPRSMGDTGTPWGGHVE